MKIILLSIALALVLASAVQAAQPDSAVYSDLNGDGQARVIVKLKENATYEGGVEKEYEFATVNAFVATIDYAELYSLSKNKDVEKIEADVPVYAALQDSVPLINGTLVHNLTLMNVSITGIGQSICVIDTGINYTHSALGGCSSNAFLNGSCAKVLHGYDFVNSDTNPMDDNGHGTHVSGIAAGDGSIRGVARGASLIAIKVLNAAGSGSLTHVALGIDWCANNATLFNISVITMSLGTSALNSSACDSSYTTLATAINNAVAKNITVVAATGNNGNTTHISSPGCIANTTAIGSTTKTDALSSFSNRNSLTALLAPGSSINSSYLTGGYAILSGTSMATPHAAGAAALLYQYERLEGTNITTPTVRSILNATGKRIADGSYVFSRIDVFAAIARLDNTTPSIIASNMGTTNNTNATFSANVSIRYIARDNVAVDRCWYINTTGGNISLSGCPNTSTLLGAGSYNITLYTNDTNGNQNSTTAFFSVDTIAPAVNITSPANATFQSKNITINYTVSDATNAIDKCNYSLNGAANVTLVNCTNATILASLGANSLAIFANDTAGNVNSSTVNFTVNVTISIQLQSPANQTYSAASIPLNFTIESTFGFSCRREIDGANTTMACQNTTLTFNESHHYLKIWANDTQNNTEPSSRIDFDVDAAAPSLAVQSPSNTTLTAQLVPINFTASDFSLSGCWYSIDNNATNVTIAGCANTTIALNESFHTLRVAVNDTIDRRNVTEINFSVDASGPRINISNPLNTSLAANSTNLNFTILDAFGSVNLSSCVRELDSANASLASCANVTLTNLSEGHHYVRISGNDTTGNTNSSRIDFEVDFTPPNATYRDPTPDNVTNTTSDIINISILASEALRNATLTFNGTPLNMSGNGSFWSLRMDGVGTGNYTFNVTMTDIAGNANVTPTRWVFVNATRNFTSFMNSLRSALLARNISVDLINASGNVSADKLRIHINHTLRFNSSGTLVEVRNFTWLNTNVSALINVTNITSTTNLSQNLSTFGTVLDRVIWIDMNGFLTANFTAHLTFPGRKDIYYYLTGEKNDTFYMRITSACNSSFTNTPCFVRGADTEIYLPSFSGAAAGNDTTAPSLSVSSPASITYSTSSIDLSYTATDSLAVDSCWYQLNGAANVTLSNCTNTTLTAASGSNTLIVAANDTANNANQTTIAFTFSQPEQSVGGGSGGGGGGGGGASTPSKKALLLLPSIIRDAKISVSNPFLPVNEIAVAVTMPQNNVRIEVEPTDAQGKTLANTYQYFTINATGLNSSAIASATIKFSVNKSWFGDTLNASSTSLYRYSEQNSAWEKRPTELLAVNNTHYTYLAHLDSFSLFAIAAEPAKQGEQIACAQVITPAVSPSGMCQEFPTPCDVPSGWQTVEKCPQQQQEPRLEQQPAPQLSMDFLLGVATVGVLLIIIIFSLLWFAHHGKKASAFKQKK